MLDGRIVRLTEGDYARAKAYAHTDLQEIAAQCLANGINWIHIVDLNRAKGDDTTANESLALDTLAKTAIHVQWGGGVRSVAKAKSLLDAGIAKVIVGTAAATDEHFLPNLKKNVTVEKIIVSADVLENKIKIHGWKESAPIDLHTFLNKVIEIGCCQFLITNIALDGKLSGIDPAFYEKIANAHPEIKIIASGGVSSMKDIEKLSLTSVESVVVGKALYERKISLREIGEWNRAC